MGYFLKINNQVIGPMNAHQVMAYDVNPNIAVSSDGVNWAPLYAFPELMQVYHNGNARVRQDDEVRNKRILCGIMALLFGYLGIHYFILGKTAGGLFTILLSVITCSAWSLITFIQGIYMLCMTDSEFERKYVDSTSTMPLF